MSDNKWMQRALELARRGQGHVEPNPMVGAVIVRDGLAVGEGWHQRFGEAHAEVNALAEAGDRARGATLYVTLEPCCHHGKTPPCTDAILKAGINRVLAAMADSFPRVAGGGIAQLRQAGVAVEIGLLERDARKLNAPYLTLLGKQRPWVHAKWAMTLDGKIATRTGHSHWISSEESRRNVHKLRSRMDAIIVGSGTVRFDNPLLTARPPGPRTPTRIVLSSTGLLRPDCQLLQTRHEEPLLIATTEEAAATAEVKSQGCEIVGLPRSNGRPDVAALLQELGRRRYTNVLVEAGAEVLGSFRDAGLIDEVHVFIAPRLIGGAAALPPIGGAGVANINEGMTLSEWSCEPSGPDWYVHGLVQSG
ncbi:MAG TPA: bifunctional diaminohydroxyphosphoribosylaminopyrimidine deaminase/5-amino-6-(5-phosphoribosylamino)uracil reductase RibD [Gemmataceae bacterium]|nr:bifunctional diaminohydroxyphosphoribosylaminopyrimidine deaminase/5-amino-6-(5-phosphoribosylamino)uracil reductase RibD [Gemmataceae bacterium]